MTFKILFPKIDSNFDEIGKDFFRNLKKVFKFNLGTKKGDT